MNIFYLDEDPVLAAQAQCDKHVVKMILESAQLLCTAHWVLDTGAPYTTQVKFYKATHVNHPCSKWVRHSQCNYNWLVKHALALCEEYSYRYNRIHASLWTIAYCSLNSIPVDNLAYKPTTPALAMPDIYKTHDPIGSYRDYYWYDKRVNIKMVWTKRGPPSWWLNYEQRTTT